MQGTNVVLRGARALRAAVPGLVLLVMVAMALSPLFAQELATWPATSRKASPPVQVCVFTEVLKDGFVVADSKVRVDSVNDIRKQFKSRGIKKLISAVNKVDDAALVLEVTSVDSAGIRAVLRLRDSTFTLEIVGTASDVASQVVKWVEDNDARIPRYLPPSPSEKKPNIALGVMGGILGALGILLLIGLFL